MINLTQNKDEILDWTALSFMCNQQKNKGIHGQYSVEVYGGKLVHRKEHGNYYMSLLMPE